MKFPFYLTFISLLPLYASFFSASHDVAWVFYPGVCDGPTEVVHYTGAFETVYENIVHTNRWIPLIDPDSVYSCKGAEILFRQPPLIGTEQRFVNETILGRFLFDVSGMGKKLFLGQEGVPEHVIVRHNYDIDLAALNIGQESDQLAAVIGIKKICEQYSNRKLVLVGFSRGAVAFFNTLALCHGLFDLSRIAGVVLIGCFGQISHATSFRSRSSFFQNIVWGLSLPLLRYAFPAMFIDRVDPLDCVKTFPSDIPVMFVTSQSDVQVTPQSTQELALALAQRNQQPVYLLELTNALHDHYYKNDPEGARLLRDTVHALYQELDVWYEPTWADVGRSSLVNCLLNSGNETY